MIPRFAIRSLRLAAVAVVLLVAGADADLVILTNGRLVVGRVVKEDQAGLQLASGTEQGPRDISVPRAEVERLLKGDDELRRIKTCNDAPLLAQWTAAYYFARLETSATRCLERALTLDPAVGAKPRTPVEPVDGPAAKFVTFWNRAVLRRRTASIPKGDAKRLLELARWTRAAGMTDLAAYYLRRAANTKPGDAVIRRLATEWNVALESWVQLDLTPALDESLIAHDLVDENVRVPAESGKLFLWLPIRYQAALAAGSTEGANAQAPSLSRTSLTGKDVRGFYGLKNAPAIDGRIRLAGLDLDPVFERLEFLPGPENAGLVVLRNKLGPRRVGDDDKQKSAKPRQARLRDAPRTVRSTGAAAILLEIPETTRQLTLEWSTGLRESIDVAFLRAARETAPDKIRARKTGSGGKNVAWSSVPAVAESLAIAKGSSRAMAALAIERLSRIRSHLILSLGNDRDDEAFTSWIDDVDSAVIADAVRDDERIRVAAWRYFCTHPADRKPSLLPDETLDLFADAEPDVQSHWAQIIACGLRVDDGGSWWRQTAGLDSRAADLTAPDANPPLIDRANAVAILGALLRSEDDDVASETMDVLANLQPPISDWGFLEEASVAAQRAVLAHVAQLADRQAAAPLVQALVLSARPETAVEIAEAAKDVGVASDDPNDMLLTPWWSLHPASRKPAFLSALGGVRLGEVVYTRRFADVIADATTASDAATREAAWRLLIAQLRLRKGNVEADERADAGPFPLIIARSANDPLTQGVIAATQKAGPAVRLEALQALVEAGYAEQAAVCLMDANLSQDEREAALTELIALADEGHRDAVLAMLGALLNEKCESSAARILDQLSRTVATVDQKEHWRVLAAVKAGVNLAELDDLGLRLGPPTSNAVVRWLHALGHMSPQDRQRLAASRDPAERKERLAHINYRRGQVVDGRYGVVAIVATTRRLEPLSTESDLPDASPRWSTPQRVTLVLDPLVLETIAHRDDFRVRWGDRTIGEGLVLQQPQPIRGPAAYLPAIETAGPWNPTAPPAASVPRSEDGAGGDSPIVKPVGPLRIPDRSHLERQAAGTMTLDVGAYLTDALKRHHLFDEADASGMLAEDYKITLRYGTFGSFYGCGPRRSPWSLENSPRQPGSPTPPRPIGSHLVLNVILVVERMD